MSEEIDFIHEHLQTVSYISHEERGTSYRLAFAKLPPEAEDREGAPILVTCLSPYRGAYAFHSKYGFLHWTYIKEKYPGLSVVDAQIVAKLIAQALDRPYSEVEDE